MSTTPNLLITHISASQNQKEVTANAALDELDEALTNILAIAMSDANYTLSTGEGGQALSNMVFKFTGTLTANRNIIVPTNKKIYIVSNQTTGGFSLTVKTPSGTGIALASTAYSLLYCDGTNVVALAGAVSGSTTLAGDTDVLITSPANNDVLTYETSSTKWKNKVPTAGTLAGDTDVVISSPANNDVLTYETSSTKWKNKPAAGGGGTLTVRIPIELRNPRESSLQGNSFFTVSGLTAWDAGHWELVPTVDGKIYGIVSVPHQLAGTPNASIILVLAANATTGAVRMQVSDKNVASAGSLNPGSLTAETASTTTVPGTARLRFDVSFTLTNPPAADDILIVEVFRVGTNGADTLAVNLELYEAWLQVDVNS